MWQFKGSGRIESEYILPFELSSPFILIHLSSNVPSTWSKVGWLSLLFDSEIGDFYKFGETLFFGLRFYDLRNSPLPIPFKIKITLVDWIQWVNFSIYENTDLYAERNQSVDLLSEQIAVLQGNLELLKNNSQIALADIRYGQTKIELLINQLFQDSQLVGIPNNSNSNSNVIPFNNDSNLSVGLP